MTDKGYANPDVLVSTQWVAEHLNDTDNIRLVESNEDVLLYSTGHIPNAVHIDWVSDLNDPVRRDYLDADAFAALASKNGIGPSISSSPHGRCAGLPLEDCHSPVRRRGQSTCCSPRCR
jgi:3-mercaptopyruvate sulfurtransferase SseA